MSEPLISCIMPTADRRAFVPQALRCFSRQTYPNRELIVVDDGADGVSDLCKGVPNVRYTALHGKHSVGEKRNIACEQADGEFIAHWDDDDWHHPERLESQLSTLCGSTANVCGQDNVLYFDVGHQRAWRYQYPSHAQHKPGWVAGNTFFYWREYWSASRFLRVSRGEDTRFLWDAPRAQVEVSNTDHVVGIIHALNVAPKQPEKFPGHWTSVEQRLVEAAIGGDMQFYRDFGRGASR